MEASHLVYVVSHGEATNRQVHVGKSFDNPLSDRGCSQAQGLAAQLTSHGIVAVYSSPQLCAIQTASEIAKANRSGLLLRQGLSAINYGDWSEQNWRAISASDRARYAEYCRCPATFCFPAGESLADAQRRAFAVLGQLSKQHNGKSSIAIVVNKQISQALIAKCSNIPLTRLFELEQQDGCLNVLKKTEDGWQVRAINILTVDVW